MKKILIFICSIIIISLMSNAIISYASQLKINSGQVILNNAVMNINPRYPDFVAQWLQTRDDWVSNEGTSNEYILEEAVWTTVTGSPFEDYDGINYEGDSYTLNLFSGAVKRDERTGLWWSDIAASTGPTAATSTNSFTNGAVDGVRPTTGHAVLFCNALNTASFAGYTNWYLPTQKELMQAYIDGSANNLVRPGYLFWSSSEQSWASTSAWAVYLHTGVTTYGTKTGTYNVRCVRR